jgi:ATP-dependent DNA helicase RecQ
MLRRGADLPRTALVVLRHISQDETSPDFVAFCQAARLKPGQSLTLNLCDVARQLALALDDLEPRLLAWADAGWLMYLPSGRDLSLALLPPPADAAERVATLLERYATIQAQRVDEIAAYAQTGRCRHGYLNAYLGGRTIERCTACDNCVVSAPVAEAALPDEREQAVAILRALAESRGWGRATFIRLLRGDAKTPDYARGRSGFGALAFRSTTALGALIDRLEAGAFLQGRQLDHGGTLLEITPAGRKALQDPTTLAAVLAPPAPVTGVQSTLTGETVSKPEPDAALLEKLMAWRMALAKEKRVPLYVIFNNQVLEAIAVQQPVTLEALEKIKGIGPAKVAHYGEIIVELVKVHLGE